MYNFVDRPHRCLGRGHHFLLWAMRCWVLLRERELSTALIMERSFSRLGLLTILPTFDALMDRLHSESTRRLLFGDHAEPMILESEAVMLALWCDVDADGADRAHSVLRLIVREDAVDAIQGRMTCIARCMAAEGLTPAGSPPLASPGARNAAEPGAD